MKHTYGNAIAEYLLIGVGIVGVCIAAVYFTAQNFDGVLAGVKADLGTNIGSAKKMAASSKNTGSVAFKKFMKTTPIEGLNVDSGHIQNMVQTSGANGTTAILLGDLDKTVDKLLQSGKITEGDAAQLKMLANKGHQIAEIEALLENAADAANGDATAFMNTRIEYQGKVYEPKALSNMIGWLGNHTAGRPDPLSQDIAAGQVLGEFIDTYHTLEQSGVLSNPAVKEKITSLSSDISLVSEAVQHFSHNASVITTSDIQTYVQTDVGDQTASELTDTNATKICTTAGLQDTGTNCQPLP